MTYTDGHQSPLFKTQIEVNENCLSLTSELLNRTKFIQVFGVQPRNEPGYITRVLLQDARNGTLEDWKPDYVQSGDNRHMAGPRIEIGCNEEIVGVFGAKQDITDTMSEFGLVLRPKQGLPKAAKNNNGSSGGGGTGNSNSTANATGVKDHDMNGFSSQQMASMSQSALVTAQVPKTSATTASTTTVVKPTDFL